MLKHDKLAIPMQYCLDNIDFTPLEAKEKSSSSSGAIEDWWIVEHAKQVRTVVLPYHLRMIAKPLNARNFS